MGVGNMSVSAVEAGRQALGWQKKMNNGRAIPRLLPRIAKLQEEVVHVFSVSPWQHNVAMGSWGSFVIPACPEGEEYVEFLMPHVNGELGPVPGLMVQTYVKNENELDYYEEDGREWAEKLLGNDSGIPPYVSLNRYGVFVAKGDKPSKKELDTARAELHQKLMDLVTQARQWEGDQILRQGINREVHHKAANLLGLTEESWMLASNPQGRKKCKMCGHFSDPEVIKCGNCKEYVFDPAAYKALLAEQKAS